MSSHRHPLRSPDIPALLSSLRNFSVSFVVVGSAAVKMHGVDLEPGDLDIVPDLESANLLRLVAALRSLEASVSDIDRVGHWLTGEDGEWSWTSREATDAERGALLAGELRADDIDSLDHHFLTKHGNLDVVPRVAGEYSELVARARTMTVEVAEVQVAHVDDLLARLTVPRRKKDVARVKRLRELQRKVAAPCPKGDDSWSAA